MTAAQEVGGRAWTQEQRAAIERREGDLLLDAAAGSGKTAVLVERFVRSVLDDGIDLGAILTITFTDKAAAELRERIRRRLHELDRPDLARAAEGAYISTIHGFCARILRAHPLAAGLDPEFAVLDAQRARSLAAVAFDRALEDLGRARAQAVELVAAYGAPVLRGAILGLHGQLRAAGMASPRLPEAPAGDLAGGLAAVAAAADALARELGAVATPGARVVEALQRLERCRELLGACVPPRDDLWPGALRGLRLPGGNGAALCTDACTAYREALDALQAACAARAAGPVRDLLDLLLDGFNAHYEALKRERSQVDFEDLELVCRRLLRADHELRDSYADRLQRIMVDELQDTNPVQLELIESLARDNLFTVGDAQQSIYGFRHADVDLFERRGERLAARGARLTLETNFRSAPEILDAINLAFSAELGERFRPLRAGRAGADEVAPREPRIELLLVDKGADWDLEGLASPWRLAEARALAERVAELVAAGAAAGDVVVLVRATGDMRAYERALEARGLPTYVIGGRGYWDHPQVIDVVAYLRALANPLDEEALYTVLSSPMGGATLDALVVVAAAARETGLDPWSWLSGGQAQDALSSLDATDLERVRSFVAWFAAARAAARGSSLERLIDDALRETAYDLAMLAMPGGRRRLANVRKLMRLAREFEAERGPDLRGFVDLLDERSAGGGVDPRESEAPVEGEGLDAVRLMTIHKAKGLEFEIVCVADLGRSVRPPSEIVRVEGDRIGLRLARAGAGGREPALEYRALGEERRRAEEAEERRLFYVAMTRARERLVLSGAAKFDGWMQGGATGGGPVTWIAPALLGDPAPLIADGGGVARREGVEVALRVAGPPAPGQGAAGAGGAPGVPGQGAAVAGGGTTPPPRPQPPPLPERPSRPKPPSASLSYSALHAYSRCGYRFYVERVLGLGRGGRQSLGPGAERGLLLHAVLERLDFRRPASPGREEMAAACRRAALSAIPDPGEERIVSETVSAFAASELCARLARAGETRREERFAFLLGAGTMIGGTFDVLAREAPGRMLVVDYKSDRLAGRDPAALVSERYAAQQAVYALAALRTGARHVEVVHVFLERPGEPVSAAFEASDGAGLERELDRLAAGLLRGEYPVSPEPHRDLCEGCPAESGLCSWPPSQTRRPSPDRLF